MRTQAASGLVLVLASCSVAPLVPLTSVPSIETGQQYEIAVPEPGTHEIVIVINDNVLMVHAGIFAGSKLLDPAGSYEETRRKSSSWNGPKLRDYVHYQLEDSPVVRLYRFTLPPEKFAQIKDRIDKDTGTMPLLCATAVQNMISGIQPFEAVPVILFSSPAQLGNLLDLIIHERKSTGACYWPNGASCYPLAQSAS